MDMRLGDVTHKIGSGATPLGGSSVYVPEGISLIRSQNVHNDGFHRDGLAFINEQHAAELNNVIVERDDVLLNITGDSVARVCQVPDDVLPARVNQHVSIIRPQPDKLDPKFLRYYLASPTMQDRMFALAAAGATRNALTKGMIEEFDLPDLDISEQSAIAHVLGTLDDKIGLNRRMNETLKALAQAIFDRFFPYSPQEELPQDWAVGRLDEVLVLQRGFDLPTPQRVPGSYPVVAASGPSGTHNQFMVRGPGVTTGRSGVLGNVFFVHEDFWPLNTSLWVKDFRHSTPAYAFYLLRRLDFGLFNAGSAVPTLNRNHVHNLMVAIPPMRLVEAFDSEVMPLLKRQRANDDESETLSALRDALLPKLLSGEISIAGIQSCRRNTNGDTSR
jgi:type I restriction enzyme, S subunit